MLFKYIASLYAKHLFFILLALVSFFVFFDYVMVVKHLSNAVNLQLLYISLKAMEALDMLWMLALVFAFLTSWLSMVKSNALVSLYAMGYKIKYLLFPFVVIFLACYTFILILHTTEYSYAKDKSKQIRSYGMFASASANLFFKYKDKYVFFQYLLPLQQKALNIRILSVANGEISIIKSKEAFFTNNQWILPEASMITIEDNKVISNKMNDYSTLSGFKPKVLESVYEVGSSFSIEDALNALVMLQEQGLQTNKIRSVLYSKMFVPLYFLILILIFFNKLPIHNRFSNTAAVLIVYLLIVLFLWGFLFVLQKLALTSVLDPEIALLLPLFILMCYTAVSFYRKKLS